GGVGIARLRELAIRSRRRAGDTSFARQVLTAVSAAALLTRATAEEVRGLQPDVIYVPSAELLPSLAAAMAVGRIRKIPVVACAQTVVSWRPKPKYDAQQRLTRRLLTSAAATIVLGPAVASTMRSEGFS